MADFSSYTHKWRATSNHNQHLNNDKVTKRNRQPVSCQPCRQRKLKCDRGNPCDGCVKRNEDDLCVYGKPLSAATPSATSNGRKDDHRVSTSRAQDRLKHLEDLVRSLVDSPQRTEPSKADSSASSSAANGEEPSLLRIGVDGGSYAGSTHWSAILKHIHELKHDIATEHAGHTEEPIDCSKPDALFGDQRPPSLEHVLKAYLPPRNQVDRRVSQYFNAKYMIIPFLHAKQFRRQYDLFWHNTTSANPLWVSILFSICCLAATLSLASDQSPQGDGQTPHPRDAFQTAAGQCLVYGNYSKPQRYVVEALALFLQCKYSSSLDPQREVALVFSIQIRLAYLMGYHRDGSKLPNQFSPFETEMRRRTWAMIKQFDQMVAFQLGLPNNIAPHTWDTRQPSNLLDTDFDEDTKVLPSSRAETDITQMLYFVVKSRNIDVFAKVCHHAIAFPPRCPTGTEIMALDAEIRQTAASIPEALRARPISESITDAAHEIMVRINLTFLWRKSLCVLHRKYMMLGVNEYSYRTCVETASAMCATVLDIYPEFQAGGTFENDAWMLTSFTIIDFLLAAVILCLAMSVSRKKYLSTGGNPQQWLQIDDSVSILSILDRSQNLCTELGQRSREAKRVSGVLSAMLEKLRNTKQIQTNFIHMSNGTSREDGKVSGSPLNGVGTRATSCCHLPQTDQPASIVPSSSMVPPDWSVSTRTNEPTSIGQIDLSPTRNASPLGLAQSDTNPGRPAPDTAPPSSRRLGYFSGMSAAPIDFSTDIELGPFSQVLGGEDFNYIDWTQFDQFTGFYGSENNIEMFDPVLSATQNLGDIPSQNMQYADYGNWESTPVYSLGGRARDPFTGKSHPT